MDTGIGLQCLQLGNLRDRIINNDLSESKTQRDEGFHREWRQVLHR